MVDSGAPGWRRGVAVAVAAQLLSVLGFSCAVSFLPLYIQKLGVDSPAEAAVWAGMMSFAQAIAVALCSPLWGVVADRRGAKLMVERAMFGGAAVFCLASYAGRVEWLLALFLLLGCFTGVNTAIATLVSSLAPRDRLGMSIGYCQTGVFVGSSVGPLLGGLLADAFSYRVGIRGGACFLLLAGLLVLVGVREPQRVRPAGEQRTLLAGLAPRGLPRPLLLLCGLIFIVQFSLQMITPVLPIFVQQLAPETNRVATIVGLVLAVGGVCGALGAVVWGRAADRFGQHRVLTWTTLGGGGAIMSQALVGGIAPLLALRGAGGFFTGGLVASANAAIGLVAPVSARGAAFGVAGSAFSLGNALGPLLGGFLAAGAGPRVVLALSGTALVGGCLLTRALARHDPAATAPAAAVAEGDIP
jgi:MFS transporter, DHA1 family, multidrug resistance protein